jgi:hypothetical protein
VPDFFEFIDQEQIALARVLNTAGDVCYGVESTAIVPGIFAGSCRGYFQPTTDFA